LLADFADSEAFVVTEVSSVWVSTVVAPRNYCCAWVIGKGRTSYRSNNLFGVPASSFTLRSACQAQVVGLGDIGQFGGFRQALGRGRETKLVVGDLG